MHSGSPQTRSIYELAKNEADSCLHAFLFSESERDALKHFARLDNDFITVDIQATILRELWRGKPVSNEDLYELNDSLQDLSMILRGKLFLRLLALRRQFAEMKGGADTIPEPVHDLRAYTVTVAEHGCVDYLRQKYPGRHALDVSLRAACAVSSFPYSVWCVSPRSVETEWYIGEQIWQNTGISAITLRDDSRLQYQLRITLDGVARANALKEIFSLCRAPLRYRELLAFLSELWNVELVYRAASLEQVSIRVGKPYLIGIQPEEIVNRMGVLQDVWNRLTPLTTKQSATLLLKSPQFNEGSFLEELIRFDLTTWEDLASKTGIAVSDLQEAAPNLPLPDDDIARLLHIETESVRRIRQDARLKMERHTLKKNMD